MLWPKKNSYKEFDNKKEFLRLENSQHPPPPGKFLLVESAGMRENFPVESGIQGFGIWNMALGIRNPTNDWNPGSKFHWPRIRNPVPGVRNPWCGIQNPRLAWIPFHGAKLRSVIYKLLHATFNLRYVQFHVVILEVEVPYELCVAYYIQRR